MNRLNLRNLIFLALCCDIGLFSKRLISPAANLITDWLRIPGGISTSYSLMFLVIAAAVLRLRGCATLMGGLQALIALSLGMSGSMGALAPIGYIVPGAVIDGTLFFAKRLGIPQRPSVLAANSLSAISAALCANLIVFRLPAPVLLVYLSVAAISGILFGCLANLLIDRIKPLFFRPRSSSE